MYSLYMGPNDPQQDKIPERDLNGVSEMDYIHGSLK